MLLSNEEPSEIQHNKPSNLIPEHPADVSPSKKKKKKEPKE